MANALPERQPWRVHRLRLPLIGWVGGWMDRWTDGGRDGGRDGWTDGHEALGDPNRVGWWLGGGWVGQRSTGASALESTSASSASHWVGGWRDGRMDGGMDGRMDGGMDRRTRGPRCPQWGRKVRQHSMGGAGVPVGLKWGEKGQNWGLLGWVWHQNDVGWVSWSLPWPKWGKKTQIWALLRCVCHQNDVGWFSPLPFGQNGSKNPKFGHF